jgi:hypothetical protein
LKVEPAGEIEVEVTPRAEWSFELAVLRNHLVMRHVEPILAVAETVVEETQPGV